MLEYNQQIYLFGCQILVIHEKTYHSVSDYKNKSSPLFVQQKISYAGDHAELHLILSCEKGYQAFSVFIVQEHSAENLEFFTAVNSFESFVASSAHRLTASSPTAMSTVSQTESINVVQDDLEGGEKHSLRRSSEKKIGNSVHRFEMQAIHDAAESVVNKFISQGSNLEVNIPGKMRSSILENVKSYKELTDRGETEHHSSYLHVFTDAKKEIYCLMEKDIFPRWKNTRAYKSFLEEIRPKRTLSSSSQLSLSRQRKTIIESSVIKSKPTVISNNR
jgi:hypothetical protein